MVLFTNATLTEPEENFEALSVKTIVPRFIRKVVTTYLLVTYFGKIHEVILNSPFSKLARKSKLADLG